MSDYDAATSLTSKQRIELSKLKRKGLSARPLNSITRYMRRHSDISASMIAGNDYSFYHIRNFGVKSLTELRTHYPQRSGFLSRLLRRLR